MIWIITLYFTIEQKMIPFAVQCSGYIGFITTTESDSYTFELQIINCMLLCLLYGHVRAMWGFSKINFRSMVFTAIPIFSSKNIRHKNAVYISSCICYYCMTRISYGFTGNVLSLTHRFIITQRCWARNGVYKYLQMSWVSSLWQHISNIQTELKFAYILSIIEPLNPKFESMWQLQI